MLVCKGLKLEGRGLFHGLGKSKTYMEKEVYQKFNTCKKRCWTRVGHHTATLN
jgi:hypothetical protein